MTKIKEQTNIILKGLFGMSACRFPLPWVNRFDTRPFSGYKIFLALMRQPLYCSDLQSERYKTISQLTLINNTGKKDLVARKRSRQI